MGKKNIFSSNLCALMEGKGMTVRQAAKIAGVSVSTIQSWRSGSSPNDYIAVRRLATELETTLSWLLTGEHEEHVPFDATSQRLAREEHTFFSGYAYVTVHKLKRGSEPNSGF